MLNLEQQSEIVVTKETVGNEITEDVFSPERPRIFTEGQPESEAFPPEGDLLTMPLTPDLPVLIWAKCLRAAMHWSSARANLRYGDLLLFGERYGEDRFQYIDESDIHFAPKTIDNILYVVKRFPAEHRPDIPWGCFLSLASVRDEAVRFALANQCEREKWSVETCRAKVSGVGETAEDGAEPEQGESETDEDYCAFYDIGVEMPESRHREVLAALALVDGAITEAAKGASDDLKGHESVCARIDALSPSARRRVFLAMVRRITDTAQ